MQILPNDFTSYELTEEELNEALNFTVAQKAHLQNLLSDAAISKLNLHYDATNPLVFAQQEAELTGQIGILRHLLSK